MLRNIKLYWEFCWARLRFALRFGCGGAARSGRAGMAAVRGGAVKLSALAAVPREVAKQGVDPTVALLWTYVLPHLFSSQGNFRVVHELLLLSAFLEVGPSTIKFWEKWKHWEALGQTCIFFEAWWQFSHLWNMWKISQWRWLIIRPWVRTAEFWAAIFSFLMSVPFLKCC